MTALAAEGVHHWLELGPDGTLSALARDVLKGDATDPKAKGASFFLAKRLENYGQNPVDYPALSPQSGRAWLRVAAAVTDGL